MISSIACVAGIMLVLSACGGESVPADNTSSNGTSASTDLEQIPENLPEGPTSAEDPTPAEEETKAPGRATPKGQEPQKTAEEETPVLRKTTPQDLGNYKQQEAERELASTKLELPEGMSFRDPFVFEADELMRFEPGYFQMEMTWDWQCAWIATAIDHVRNGDLVKAGEAVDVLETLPDTDLIEAFPDFDRILTPAKSLREGTVFPTLDQFVAGCPASVLSK
jgi:hypothetical protein